MGLIWSADVSLGLLKSQPGALELICAELRHLMRLTRARVREPFMNDRDHHPPSSSCDPLLTSPLVRPTRVLQPNRSAGWLR